MATLPVIETRVNPGSGSLLSKALLRGVSKVEHIPDPGIPTDYQQNLAEELLLQRILHLSRKLGIVRVSGGALTLNVSSIDIATALFMVDGQEISMPSTTISSGSHNTLFLRITETRITIDTDTDPSAPMVFTPASGNPFNTHNEYRITAAYVALDDGSATEGLQSDDGITSIYQWKVIRYSWSPTTLLFSLPDVAKVGSYFSRSDVPQRPAFLDLVNKFSSTQVLNHSSFVLNYITTNGVNKAISFTNQVGNIFYLPSSGTSLVIDTIASMNAKPGSVIILVPVLSNPTDTIKLLSSANIVMHHDLFVKSTDTLMLVQTSELVSTITGGEKIGQWRLIAKTSSDDGIKPGMVIPWEGTPSEYAAAFDGTGKGIGEFYGYLHMNGSNGTTNMAGHVIVGAGIYADPVTLTNITFTAGDLGGERLHKLIIAELAKHFHTAQNSNDQVNWGKFTTGNSGPEGPPLQTDEAGGDVPHNNMPPYKVMYWIKKINVVSIPPGYYGLTVSNSNVVTWNDGLNPVGTISVTLKYRLNGGTIVNATSGPTSPHAGGSPYPFTGPGTYEVWLTFNNSLGDSEHITFVR